MNVVIQIQGRAAIPVRALPLLTNWELMSPDIVAHVLGGTNGSNVGRFGDLHAHSLEDGKLKTVPQGWWVKNPLLELTALSKKIKAAERIEEIGYSTWKKQSLNELPAGVFVWKDDYQVLHDKNWNARYSMTYCALKNWDGEESDDEVESQMPHDLKPELRRGDLVDDTPLQRQLRESLEVLKRWRQPDYSPFMRPELHAVVMEGFKTQYATANIAPVTEAETAEVDSIFDKREDCRREINYWETRDDTKASDAEIVRKKLGPLRAELASLEKMIKVMRGDDLESAASTTDTDALIATRQSHISAQDTTTPAPAVAAPLSLTTLDIAHCFAGLHWTEDQWKTNLGKKPPWLAKDCIAIPGVQGVSEIRWYPVCIGAALAIKKHVAARSIRAKFQSNPLLADWLEAWKDYESEHLTTE